MSVTGHASIKTIVAARWALNREFEYSTKLKYSDNQAVYAEREEMREKKEWN